MMPQVKSIFSQRLQSVLDLVERTNKGSVLIIQQFPIIEDTVIKFPKIRETISNILAFVELGNAEILHEIIALADGVYDNILFDSDIKLPTSSELFKIASSSIKKSKLFFYSDINIWADSAIQFLLQKEEGIVDKRVLLTGKGILRDVIAQRLNLLGASCIAPEADNIDVLIGCEIKSISADERILDRLNPQANIYDIGIGNFTSALIADATAKKHAIYRIDIRAGISSLVINILETDYLIHKTMGQTKIKDIDLVAGGIMGSKNAIVIDDIHFPENIIGVADGQGNFKSELDEDDRRRLAFVERLIKKVV